MKGFVRYQTIIFLMLIVTTVLVTSCGEKKTLEQGFDYQLAPKDIMLGIKSNTNTYEKSNVSLGLYYGVHNVEHNKKYDMDSKSLYIKNENEKIIFGLYICDWDYRLEVINDIEILDYMSIENHYFVKSIPEEEAFTEEYGLSMSYFKGIEYNHMEEICIPDQFLNEESGSFVIKLVAFREPLVEGEGYSVASMNFIKVSYQRIDDDRIKITL